MLKQEGKMPNNAQNLEAIWAWALSPPPTRAFYRGAHAMNGEAERDRAAAKADAIALLTLLQDTTQSRSVAERCAKAKAVLG